MINLVDYFKEKWKNIPASDRKLIMRGVHVLGAFLAIFLPAIWEVGLPVTDALKLAALPLLKDWWSVNSTLPRSESDYQERQ